MRQGGPREVKRDCVSRYPRRIYVEILQRAPGRHRLPLARRRKEMETERERERKKENDGERERERWWWMERRRFLLDSTCHAEDLSSLWYYGSPGMNQIIG